MKFKFKKTPILFLSTLFIPIYICGAFYYLLIENNGGMALAGTFFALALIVNLIILAIEQASLKEEVNLKKVWIIEILLILIVFIYLKYLF